MSNISMSDAELLKFAIENGMINTALVQEKIENGIHIYRMKLKVGY